jgi:septal ring factor EnvC (AmiA/AmiB activator)
MINKIKLYSYLIILFILSSCAKQEPAPIEIKTELRRDYISALAVDMPESKATQKEEDQEYSILSDDHKNTSEELKNHLSEDARSKDYSQKDDGHLGSNRKYITEDYDDDYNYQKDEKLSLKNRFQHEDIDQDLNSELRDIGDPENENMPNKILIEEAKEEAPKLVKKAIVKTDGIIMPVQGEIIQKFGELVDGAKTLGVNISTKLGVPVVSSADGVVILASKTSKFGNIVIIKHEEMKLQTAYAFLSSVSVSKGQFISEGDEIGAVGRDIKTNIPMIHFAVRKDNQPVDPLKYLRK